MVVLEVVVVMVVIVVVVWMHMVIISHSCSFPIRKNGEISNFGEFKECVSDGRTDRPTDRPTDRAAYRVACTRLKKLSGKAGREEC